ncbi:MAG: type II toxin-antitoxin system HicB family antitoxin [Synechococcaceae cyanobacterium]
MNPHTMKLTLECEQETDGRWIAEVPEIPGVLAYGSTPSEAMARAQALALRVLADRLEHNEDQPHALELQLPVVA